MSNNLKKLPKQEKPRKHQAQAETNDRGGALSLRQIVGGAITFIGLMAAIATFYPRPTVSLSAPTDPDNPFSSTITIANNAILSLHSVSVGIAVQRISGNDGRGLSGKPGNMVVPVNWVPRELGVDGGFDLAFDQFMNFPTNDLAIADIAFVIDYETPVFHIKQRKVFPYHARKLKAGNFTWDRDAPHTDPNPYSTNSR